MSLEHDGSWYEALAGSSTQQTASTSPNTAELSTGKAGKRPHVEVPGRSENNPWGLVAGQWISNVSLEFRDGGIKAKRDFISRG